MSKDRHWSWEVFVACMFVGLGVGMLFDAAGAGVIVGMSVGFILGALLRVERAGVELRAPRGLPSAALMVIGAAFIGLGMSLLGLLPQQALRIFGGLALIALGFLSIGAGVWALRR